MVLMKTSTKILKDQKNKSILKTELSEPVFIYKVIYLR